MPFFAGFGIWSYALRLAGWPDSREVWTASCPCQPFSAAGKAGGFADERHLWPAFFHVLQNGKRPDIPLYGEQVASPDALAWLDVVQADMEAEEHTVRAFDICAAGFGSPILRQRLFWVASAPSERYDGRRESRSCDGRYTPREQPKRLCDARGLAGTDGGITSYDLIQRSGKYGFLTEDGRVMRPISERPCPTNGFWRDVDWLFCRDDRWRPVEPGTFPLAHGYPERMGILRGAGNAINAEVAKAFIEVTKDYV
jgi:DNA (cytosine-5)-methyltransferase 1